MDGKIPNYVHVLLIEAEVDARQTDVMQVAQLSAVDKLLYLDDRWAIDEGVAGEENSFLGCRQRHQLMGKGERYAPAVSPRKRACPLAGPAWPVRNEWK